MLDLSLIVPLTGTVSDEADRKCGRFAYGIIMQVKTYFVFRDI